MLNFNCLYSICKQKWILFERDFLTNAKFNSDQQKRQSALHSLYIAECGC